jgi:TatD DNase family protein
LNSPYINIHSHSNIEGNCIGIKNFLIQDIRIDTIFPAAYSIGIHPWHISKLNIKNSLQQLENLADNSQLKAIGECGLDRAVASNFDLQREVFIAQIRIAAKYNKAIIIHNVRAFSDILEVFKQEQISIPVIFHAFNGNKVIMQKLMKYDVYFSIGSDIFKENSRSQRIIADIPINRLFMETDEWTGGKIEDIYSEVSKHIDRSIIDIRNQIYYSYKSLFA